MKRAILFAAAVASLSLAACQKKDVAPTDAGTTNDAVNAAQDAASSAVGAAASTTAAATNSTDAFVTGLVTSGMYEVAAGKIAAEKARNPEVKSFARMMVADHTAMAKEADPAIKASGKPVPVELDERRKGLIDNLNAADPGAFDEVYLNQQEDAHNEALTLLKGYAGGGDNAGLKTVASGAIAKVQSHLDKIKEIKSKR